MFSRRTAHRRITSDFPTVRSNVIAFIKKHKGKISITVDGWTSRAQKPFLGIKMHLIDSNYALQEIVADIIKVPHPHSGKEMRQAIQAVLSEFDCPQILSVTTDNGANMVNAVKELHIPVTSNFKKQDARIYPRRCIAHILNLAAKAGLQEIKPVIKKVSDFATLLHSSSSLTQDLEELCGEDEVSFLIVPKDVTTRWNSTFLMIRSYLKLFEQIQKVLILRNKINLIVSEVEKTELIFVRRV
ncbi:hypothetical protein GEMRC1_005260 [Eukaryota sp. GEM-RC1]